MTLSASKCSPLSCILNSLTVKPALEKHLSEKADGAQMQKLLQIRKLKLWDHHFMYHFKRLKSLIFGGSRLGKLFFIFASPENFLCLTLVVKKFEFWRPCLVEPLLGQPQILSNFIFALYFLT